MFRSSFWKFRPNKFLGRRVKTFPNFFLAILNLEKTYNLALGQTIYKVSAHPVQKKILAAQKRDRFLGQAGPHTD